MDEPHEDAPRNDGWDWVEGLENASAVLAIVILGIVVSIAGLAACVLFFMVWALI